MSAQTVGGRYRVERSLGHGGMATVDLARDAELDRQVAIKRLSEALSGDEIFRERFSARRASPRPLASEHRRRVRRRRGRTGSRTSSWSTSRARRSPSCSRESGPLDPDRAVDLILQACAGLEHAHAAGLVHRDIKPQNLLVRDDDTLKIADFGIARPVDGTQLTQAGTILGTAAYLAPEQALGERVTRGRRPLLARRGALRAPLRPAAVRVRVAGRAAGQAARGASAADRRCLAGAAGRACAGAWRRTLRSGRIRRRRWRTSSRRRRPTADGDTARVRGHRRDPGDRPSEPRPSASRGPKRRSPLCSASLRSRAGSRSASRGEGTIRRHRPRSPHAPMPFRAARRRPSRRGCWRTGCGLGPARRAALRRLREPSRARRR